MQDERFRQQLGNAHYVENVLVRQQFNHWRYYELNRQNEAFLALEEEAAAAKSAEADNNDSAAGEQLVKTESTTADDATNMEND